MTSDMGVSKGLVYIEPQCETLRISAFLFPMAKKRKKYVQLRLLLITTILYC